MFGTARLIDTIAIGQVLLGKYRVESILGLGGMGVVAQCMHIALNERVAIKMMRQDVSVDDAAIERFIREARAAAKLKSEYAARVSDVGSLEDGTHYMVMEYLEGHDLGSLLEQRGRLPVAWAAELVLQAAEALSEAHSLNIVHRDVKPTNLFVTWRPDGTALIKVLDFGVSKVYGSAELRLTNTQSLLGTPTYMSPEQMRSARHVDPRADIWALGVVLYELVEGSRPFEAESFTELCVKVSIDSPLPMATAPPDLQRVVSRCLEKNPAQRYDSMWDLGRDLLPFVKNQNEAVIIVERMERMLRRTGALPASPPADVGIQVSASPDVNLKSIDKRWPDVTPTTEKDVNVDELVAESAGAPPPVVPTPPLGASSRPAVVPVSVTGRSVVQAVSPIVEPKPSVSERASAGSERVPAVIEPRSCVVERAPMPVEPRPSVSKRTPASIEPMPSVVERAPAVEHMPSVSEQSPAVVEQAPVIVERAPSEAVPAVGAPRLSVSERPPAIERMPSVSERSPASVGERSPAVVEPRLSVSERSPAVVEPRLSVSERSPAVVEPRLSVSERSPAVVEPRLRAPVVVEPRLSVSERAPVVVEPRLSVSERAPVVVEPRLSVSERSPAVVESRPSVRKSAPAVVEPRLSVSERAPAVVEPSLSVSEHAPAVVEPRPSLRKSAPAVVEPKPVIGNARSILGSMRAVDDPTPTVDDPTAVDDPTPDVVDPGASDDDPTPRVVDPAPVRVPAPEIVSSQAVSEPNLWIDDVTVFEVGSTHVPFSDRRGDDLAPPRVPPSLPPSPERSMTWSSKMPRTRSWMLAVLLILATMLLGALLGFLI